MRKCLVLSVLVLLMATRAAESQLAVIDPANLTQNTISAIQDVVIAIEAVLQTANQVLELTPVEGLVTGDLGDDMAILNVVVENAEGLSYDINVLQSQIAELFDLEHPPNTTLGLEERLLAIRQVRFQCYAYAMRAQNLLTTASRTVDHLIGLIEALGDVIGNLSVSTRAVEVSSTISKTVANLQVTTMAYERAGSVDKMEELFTAASIRAIQRRFWFKEE
jgi:conjugal transfer/entry exclusion protein